MTQRFTITDIRRTLVGESGGVASVTLTPVAQEGTPTLMPPQPFGAGSMNPSPAHLTGIPVADVSGWDIGDTITLTATKSL